MLFRSAKPSSNKPLDEHEKLNYFVSGNPLLAAWGKVGRDFLDKLTNTDAEILDLFIEQAEQPLTHLNKIQSDILKLEYRDSSEPLSAMDLMGGAGKQIANPFDDSISIHSCHSPIRELEVLKDKLLAWFEQDDSLQPKDVLVMMPDVEKYAPFISSVFNEHVHSEQQIPYTVSDRGALAENPVLNTFTEILLLPNSRYSLPQLIEMVEVPEVAEQFEISTEEIKQIKSWLSECHIRWGKDAAHKTQWQLPKNDLNTWSYGFKRMLLGFSNNGNGTWHDIYSYNDIEGMDSVTLGKLLSFFHFLMTVEKALVQDKSIEQWGSYLQRLLSLLFVEQSKDNTVQHFRSLQIIRDTIEGFVSYYQNNDCEQAVNYRLVHHHFQTELNDSGVAQRFLAGKMNFCTLMPMRSVPFKVICVLGMNEGEYPRQVDPISFDLVGLNTPRKGDRSRKFDDRYLFLEALVSAKEKLHISYLGQSLTTNQPKMPSVILSELMDYLHESYIVDKKDPSKSVLELIVMTHKLQPFDIAYYQQTDALGRYIPRDAKWFDIAVGQIESIVSTPSKTEIKREGSTEDHDLDRQAGGCRQIGSQNDLNQSEAIDIELDQLIEFWSHPVKYFYRRVLGIKLEISEQALEQTEVFEHDALIRYQEAERLLHKQLAGKDLATNTQNSLRSGAYPAGRWGEALSKGYEANTRALIDRVQLLVPDMSLDGSSSAPLEKTLEIESKGNNLFLFGVAELVGNKIFYIRNGKLRPQDLISLWLKHLFTAATIGDNMALAFGNEDKVACFLSITQQTALEMLAPWLEIFVSHMEKEQLLLWHPKPACDWYVAKLKDANESELQNSLLKNLSDGFNRTLADDDYASKHFYDLACFEPLFFTTSERLLAPMYQHLILDKAKKVEQKMVGEERE